ncbi:response regulator transcription factor [Actinotignum timonense]|uniref:response regulator transcription factor n=1 Tax=Actinotignum timonense TaxID=1870995 RepID=UPI0025515C60|nr:response regulator transcription factor [Actinotignum timonense]MDK6589928.1 response regulator transcription factor [Actinotignum timonense]
MMIRIAIADDQGLLRESLAVLLEQQEDFRVVGSAGDGVEACRMVRETDIDVLLLDIRMPLMGRTGRTQGAETEWLPWAHCHADHVSG